MKLMFEIIDQMVESVKSLEKQFGKPTEDDGMVKRQKTIRGCGKIKNRGHQELPPLVI